MQPDLTVESVAETLGVSTRHVRRLIVDGELPAYAIGKRGYRVRPGDLDAWRERQRVVPRRDVVGEALAGLR